jgi:hypothetical protein
MRESLVYKIIRTLDKRDLKRISRYVRSPFFNPREDVIRLFDYLEKHVESPPQYLSYEKVFGYVYPKETFDLDKLQYTASFLNVHIKHYLAQDEFEEDTLMSLAYMVRALRKRGLDKFFEKYLDEAQLVYKKHPLRNASYHLGKFKLYYEEYEFRHRRNRATEIPQLPLQEWTDELLYFYIAEMLKQACSVIALKAATQHSNFELALLEPVLDMVEKKNLTTVPAIGAYYYAYLSLNTADTEGVAFHAFKNILVSHWQNFPASELRDLNLVAINYCIRRINRGMREYEMESLELYKFGLQNQILFENNQLSMFTYHNIMNASLKVGDYAWARQFLSDYKDFLPESERENTFQYNIAIIHYRQGEYAEAMKLLRKVRMDEVLFNLDSRRMLMRIYYELGEWMPLTYMLESTKTYIRRQKNLGYGRDHYLNLTHFLQKMLKADLKNEKIRKQIRDEVVAQNAVAEKEWLLDKLK